MNKKVQPERTGEFCAPEAICATGELPLLCELFVQLAATQDFFRRARSAPQLDCWLRVVRASQRTELRSGCLGVRTSSAGGELA